MIVRVGQFSTLVIRCRSYSEPKKERFGQYEYSTEGEYCKKKKLEKTNRSSKQSALDFSFYESIIKKVYDVMHEEMRAKRVESVV